MGLGASSKGGLTGYIAPSNQLNIKHDFRCAKRTDCSTGVFTVKSMFWLGNTIYLFESMLDIESTFFCKKLLSPNESEIESKYDATGAALDIFTFVACPL